MLWGLLATLWMSSAAPDAGRAADAGRPKDVGWVSMPVPRLAPDAGAAALSEDEKMAADLELLENLEVLEKLEQYDLGEESKR
jgi:hypothetical protein